MFARALPAVIVAATVAVAATALLWAGWRSGPSVEPGIELVDASPAQQAMVEDVLADLEREGLLADIASERVEIRFSCALHPVGLARRRGGVWQVEVCREEPWVVAHELAHVYVETTVSPEARRVLMVQRGITEWGASAGARWQDLGSEHAAEIIRWGVTGYGTQVGVNGTTEQAALAEHYQLLAGRPPSWWTGRIAEQ